MKSLIPAAVLLCAAGAAHADMTLYGLIDLSYGKSVLSDAAGLKADFHSGGDNGSGEGNSTTRLGVKGSTDVTPAIKANFKLETGGITSDGEVNPGGAFFNRQAWLGFSGSLGEVRLGKQDSVPFQTMIDFDFNGASNGVSALGGVAVGPWLPGRQSRSLQYIAPTFAGVKVQVGFVPEGNVAGDKATYSAGVTYTLGGLAVAAAVESKRTTTSAQFGSVSASYDFGVAKVMVGYADGATNVKGASLGVTAPVAGFNIGALYGKNSDTKASAYELFVNKEVFKSTYAYAEYGSVDKTTATSLKGSGFAVGVIYAF